ncbi:MAG: mycothiol system anti-sigma-R factor [Chloroflexi bacterium]|nr:MAG: mycothiol system anti-sigma-R factor [Chloroflexota bacterium]
MRREAMDCDDCLDKLYTFLDKELAPTERTAVAQHLSDCGDCEDNFGFEERFLEVLRDCGTADIAPRELRERVAERLRRTPPPPTL